MLSSGRYCQPTEIQREIELYESSTKPAKVGTDAGEGFIKGLGNPAGPAALISELIAAELGTWFGLAIPNFAIVRHCDIKIEMVSHPGYIQPPVFFSQAVDGTPRDGSDTFLRRLRQPADVALLVVFDTWIRNVDRYVEGSANSDNLLYALSSEPQKYELVPIDHSHCFVDVDFDTDLPAANLITDPGIYGLYPEFGPFIDADSVGSAIDKLNTLDRDFVVECVNAVPAEWGLSALQRQQQVDLICGRADFVVGYAPMQLVPDPKFTGLGDK